VTGERQDPGAPRVAFQGAPGAFSEEAVVSRFGTAAEPVPSREFRDVAAAVANGDVDYGLLPIENSIAGSVTAAYDVLAAGGLEIVGEVVRPIRHCLLGVAGATLAGVRQARSHPVALAQCARFFVAHPEIAAVAAYDTAGAAQEVAALGRADIAAVAARRAAERFGLAVLVEDIQDRADNQTRFFVVARPGASPPPLPIGPVVHRTVLLAETANQPGSLLALLQPFAQRGVNLTKLESRPGEAPWTYRFFLELDGDRAAAAVREALADARSRTTSFHVLGSFARADTEP
jgi:prephenate dehydratase